MAHATTRDVRVEDSPMAGHRPPDFVLGVVAGVIAGWFGLTLGGLLAMDEVGRRRRISLRFRGSARMPAGVTRA